MENKVRELYAEFAKASEVKSKWHGSFTANYIMKMFEDKFGKEMFAILASDDK